MGILAIIADLESKWFRSVIKFIRAEIIAGNDTSESVRSKYCSLHKFIDSRKWTLLHYSSEMGDAISTQWLIKYGLRINELTKDGQTPLLLALQYAREEAFVVLLKANSKIYIVDNHGRTIFESLSYHWSNKDSSIAGALLMKFLNKCKSEERAAAKLLNANCPLSIAVLTQNSRLIKIMLDRGAKVNCRMNLEGVTALHMAVYFQNANIVKLLLDNGANINAADTSGHTPLNYMREPIHCPNEQLEVLKILLFRGAHLYDNFRQDESLQIYSIFSRCGKKTIQLVLQAGVNLFTTDRQGDTPLHYMTCNKNPGVFDLLRYKALDADKRNYAGWTALHKAASLDNTTAVKGLINIGADINIRSTDGMTPLGEAFMHQSTNCVELLLDLGAEIQIEMFDFVLHYDHYFDWIQPILAHLAIRDAAQMTIDDEILMKIDSDPRLYTAFYVYKTDIQQTLRIVIYEPVTMFNLITEDERTVLNYLRNQNFVLNLERVDYRNTQNTYYYQKLQGRIERALMEIRQVRRRAIDTLCEIMHMNYDLDAMIIDQIFDYLSEADILRLSQI